MNKEYLDKLPQFDIDAKSEFCLNVNYMGQRARVLVNVKEFELQLVSGKSRIKLSFMNSNPIDDHYELNLVDA
jgi:hypothetical protein